MAEKISIQVELQGADKVQKQLADIGESGNQAFQDIGKGAESLEKTSKASQQAATELEKTSGAADKAAESYRGLSLEAVKTGAEIAKLGAEITKIGVEIGLAVNRHQGWIRQLVQLGSTANTAARALGLAVPAIGAIGTALAVTTAAIGAAVVAFESLRAAAEKGAAPYVKLNSGLQTLARTSGQSFDSLQRGQAAFAQLGISAEGFAATISKVGEAIKSFDISAELQKSADEAQAAFDKVLEAEKALLEFQVGGRRVFTIGDTAQLSEVEARLQRLQEIQAQLSSEVDKERGLQDALAAARQKSAEQAANSLSKVIEQVNALVEGQKEITFDPLTTAETKIKALTAAMKQATDSGKPASDALLKFVTNADRLSAVQVGAKFGIDEKQIDRIRRLNGNLSTTDALLKRLKDIGVLIPPEAAAAFEKLEDEIAAVEQAQQRLNQAWDSSIFARFAASIAAGVNTMKANILNFGAATLETFNQITAAVAPIAKLLLLLVPGGTLLFNWKSFGAVALEVIQRVIGGLGMMAAAISGAGVAAFSLLASAVQATGSAISSFISSLGGIAWDAISGAGVAAWNAVISVIGQAGTAISNFVSSLGGIAWDAISSAGMAAWDALISVIGQAGTAISNFVSSLGGIVWDAISSAGVAAWNALISVIGQAGTAISDFVSSLGRITWDAISNAGVAAWNALGEAIQDVINKVLRFLGLKSQAGGGNGGGGKGGKAMARGGFVGGRGSGTSDSNLAWLSRGEHVMPARVVRQPGVLAFLEMLRRGGNIPGYQGGGQVGGGLGIASQFIQPLGTAIGKPKQIYDQLAQGMEGVFTTLKQAIDTIWRAMGQTSQVLQTTLNSMKEFQIDLAKILAQLVEASKAAAKARGGLLGGRGTGTSDSNLAWVSRGEYITPARAVRQPGVLAFLEALRRSGGNLSRVLDGMGRFALGGLVPRPAFATGGAVGGMSNVTIQFPGLPAIGGLRASSDVVDQLQKAAALAQVRSGGRKPSRYS